MVIADVGDAMVNSFVALQAASFKAEYSVGFDLGGASGYTPATQMVSEGDTVMEPSAPNRTGFRFTGWYTQYGSPWNFNTPVTSNMTLTAHWDRLDKKYTVHFDLGDAPGSAPAEQTVDEAVNPYPVRPADPTWKGHYFVGWFDDKGEVFDFGGPLSRDATLTARWSKSSFGLSPVQGMTKGGTPVTVTAPDGVRVQFSEVSAGDGFSAALSTDGYIYTWGQNNKGQLGDGTRTNRTVPKRVDTPAGVRFSSVSTGYLYTAAISSDGLVYGWGLNWGQLGNNSGANTSVPVRFQSPKGVRISQIATGYYQMLALGDDGNIYAAGWNGEGQVGDGTKTTRLIPVKLEPPTGERYVQVAAGYHHSMALTNTGKIYAWGYRASGRLGTDGSNPTVPQLVNTPANMYFTRIAAGGDFSAAINSDGDVYAWGANDYGQLGNGTTVSGTPGRVDLPSGEAASAIAAGDEHMLAITTSGHLYAWGDNTQGQLGINSTSNIVYPWAVTLPASATAVNMAAGVNHTLATSNDGRIYAWGGNAYGQLNDGTVAAKSSPAAAQDLTLGIASVEFDTSKATGSFDGKSSKWKGKAPAHKVGKVAVKVHWSIGHDEQPVQVLSYEYLDKYTVHFDLGDAPGSAPADQTFISNEGKSVDRPANPTWKGHQFMGWFTGQGRPWDFSTVIDDDVQLTARWDAYAFAMTPKSGPREGGTTVSIRSGDRPNVRFTRVVSGSDFSVGLGADGLLYAWGSNYKGQLGDGSYRPAAAGKAEVAGVSSVSPVRVRTPVGVTFSRVVAGPQSALALGSDGSVYGWGVNWGELGDGSDVNRGAPVRFGSPKGVRIVGLAAGDYHALALGDDGKLYVSGYDNAGQLGVGGGNRVSPVVLDAPAGHRFVRVAAGGMYSLALTEDGRLYAWGANGQGQLGMSGSGPDSPRLVETNGVSLREVMAVGGTSAAVGSTGDVYMWGANGDGQLGDGSSVDSSSLRKLVLPGGARVAGLALGSSHAVAVDAAGRVYAWGANGSGQLGDGSSSGSSSPRLVSLPSGVVAAGVGAGRAQSFAVGATGEVYAWGANNAGQLGDGGTTNRTTPTKDQAVQMTITNVKFDGTTASGTFDPAQGRWAGTSPKHASGDVTVRVEWAIGRAQQDPVLFTYHYFYAYTVHFNLGDASGTAPGKAELREDSGLLLKRPQNPSWGTHIFMGWFTAKGQPWDFAQDVSSDMTLTAKWDTYRFTLTPPKGTKRGGTDVGISAGGGTGPRFAQVVGGQTFSAALGGDGAVYTWGANDKGQLGVGEGTGFVAKTPMRVHAPAGLTFTSVAAGPLHAIAVGSDGQAYAWGWNWGQLGNNDPGKANTNVPVHYQTPQGVRIVQVAAGYYHSLALGDDGKVYAAGWNGYGQIGNGSSNSGQYVIKPVAIDPPAGKRFVDIGAGRFHSVALTDDGKAWAWGSNGSGRLGTTSSDTTTPQPVSMPKGVQFAQITAGDAYSAAVSTSGDVYTWGDNEQGQLGFGNNANKSAPSKVGLPAGTRVQRIATGNGHMLALTDTGKLYAWGSSAKGQLGRGDTTGSNTPVEISVPKGKTYGAVGAGYEHSLATSGTGELYVWGSNSDSQLGDGGSKNRNAPKPVDKFDVHITGVKFDGNNATYPHMDTAKNAWTGKTPAHATAGNVDVALTWDVAGGEQYPATLSYRYLDVYTVRFSLAGAPGNVPAPQEFTEGDGKPVVRPDSPSWKGRSFMGWFNAAGEPWDFGRSVTADMTLAARWFAPGFSLAPNQGPSAGDEPVTLNAPENAGTRFTRVVSGSDFSVGLGADGLLYAWGSNYKGQLGDGSYRPAAAGKAEVAGVSSVSPVRVRTPVGVTFSRVVAGPQSALALGSDGSVYGWGVNWGELGDGSDVNRGAPVRFGSPKGVRIVGLAAGDYHALALGDDGKLYVSGYDNAGQLGVGGGNRVSPVVLDAPAGHRFVRVAAGGMYSLALTEDGRLYAWGANGQGQLGMSGSGPDSPRLVETNGVSLREVMAVGGTSAAVGSTGDVYMWGANGDGQLGDGSSVDSSSLRKLVLPGGARVAGLALGSSHAVAVDAAGRVYAWGANGSGQLGDGSSSGSSSPRLVSLPSGVVAAGVGAGRAQSFAVGATGEVYAWGANNAGQLGDGGTTNRTTPTK
ncbi:hypothetical protein CRD59_02275, partial [Bifidobacterium xylocopae]